MDSSLLDLRLRANDMETGRKQGSLRSYFGPV
jgi:hypothetical protein